MLSPIKLALLLAVVLFGIIVIAVVFNAMEFFKNDTSPGQIKESQETQKEGLRACFKESCFFLETADTPQKRVDGLSNRDYLDKDGGMLFVFDIPGKYGFWMRNTYISLDIIWLNEQKVTVFIKENAQPCGEAKSKIMACETFTPPQNAKYTIELQGGAVQKIGLSLGDKFDW